jgi:hypothetical protein
MNLKGIEPPALYKLIGYLEAVSDFIRTGELKWYFDVRLFEYDEVVSDIGLLVKTAYPESFPEKAEISEASITDLVETFRHEFGRRLESPERLSILTPVTDRRGEMWDHLNECLLLEESRIYQYTTSDVLDDFGSGGIVGNFAAVIVNENQRRCLFLSGGDCD